MSGAVPARHGRPQFGRFPGSQGNIVLPLASRRSAMAGISLYAPCRPAAVALHRVAWAAAAVPLLRRVVTSAEDWKPPVPDEDWDGLLGDWRSVLGSFDGIAHVERRQATRSGLACLLLRDGRPVGFVKVRPDDSLATERAALEHAATLADLPFDVPTVTGVGTVGRWRWTGFEPLPPRPHTPVFSVALDEVVGAVRRILEGTLDADGVPSHWVPIHGDLTPWNLRRSRGRHWLIDWEDAGWGPPGADEAYFSASRVALGRKPNAATSPEVARFWRARVAARPDDPGDSDMNRAILVALEVSANATGSADATSALADVLREVGG